MHIRLKSMGSSAPFGGKQPPQKSYVMYNRNETSLRTRSPVLERDNVLALVHAADSDSYKYLPCVRRHTRQGPGSAAEAKGDKDASIIIGDYWGLLGLLLPVTKEISRQAKLELNQTPTTHLTAT